MQRMMSSLQDVSRIGFWTQWNCKYPYNCILQYQIMNSVHKNDYSCIFRKNYLTLYSNTLKLSFKMQLSELLSNFDVLCVLMGYLDRSSIINLSRVSNAIGSLIQPESQRFGVHPGMNITHTEKFNKHQHQNPSQEPPESSKSPV